MSTTSRTVYIIRHCASQASRHTESNFGPEGSALSQQGVQTAKELYDQLQKLGIDVHAEPVASSHMKRAYQTAQHAGFENISKYASLNEVGGDLPPDVLDEMLAKKEAPPSAIAAARNLLKNPPPEKIWVTHGQLIAGLAYILGFPPSELFIPKMGTITKLKLP